MPRGKKNTEMKCPSKEELLIPTYDAIKVLGESGSVTEICDKIISLLNLSDEIVDEPHMTQKGQMGNELTYRVRWCLTSLKNYGAISSIGRGLYALNPSYRSGLGISAKEIIKITKNKQNVDSSDSIPQASEEEINDDNDTSLREDLLHTIKEMDPIGFERLSKRLVLAMDFKNVDVTPPSNDKGIDVYADLFINDVVKIPVAFQCKRYAGTVPYSDITEFVGALQLNAKYEKGIFITTGTFSSQTKKLAANVPQINLIDGEMLIDLLIKYQIGITSKTVYEIDRDFINNI